LTSLPKRGAIATIGNTGIGYAWLGSRTLIHGSGYFGPEFFRLYSEEGMENIGQAQSQAMTNYIIDHGVEFWSHVKMMCEWILLGDPSLMMGGYA
jgi:dihydroorotate dehydrogenase